MAKRSTDNAAVASPHKKPRIKLRDKLEILQSLSKGETGASVASRFNVSSQAVSYIKRSHTVQQLTVEIARSGTFL